MISYSNLPIYEEVDKYKIWCENNGLKCFKGDSVLKYMEEMRKCEK